jgi:hypothetical protein
MEGKGRPTCVLLLCLLVLPFIKTQAGAQSDHRLRFLTVETAHFRIHYHEPLGFLARTLASEAEAINTRVEQALGLRLEQVVELVLADEHDAANGFAVTLPYNVIRLRAAAPDDLSPLADYDDWPTTLLTHEHSHILHLEHASGVPRLLRQIFGRFYTPQGALPGWVIEGLAVVEESAHTSAGRVRSPVFDMFLRMDALAGRVLPLDLITFEGEPWPHGNVRYAYGQALMEFIKRRHGHAALGRFVREYGRRLVPYGLNRALSRATGETFPGVYRAFAKDLLERASEVARRIRAEGIVAGQRLTFHGEQTRSPRFLGDDELVYAVADARHVPELRRLSLRLGESARRIVRTGSVAQVATAPDRQRLVYSAPDPHRGVYTFSELFSIGADGAEPVQLSHGLRAREPDVSPDGSRVAFVTQSAGTSQLEIALLADVEHTRRVLVQSRRLEQVFTPRWSPDGRFLAYGAWQRGGYRDIWLIELASGLRTRVTYDRAIDRGPVFARDGKTLFFSSDRSGIANIYAYDLASTRLTQVTNVLGGAFQPDVSPDGKTLVYVGYTSRGFDLYTLDLTRSAARPALPSFGREPPRPLPEPAPLVSTRYRPLRTLAPRYWELSTEEAAGGTRAIVSTSGRDAVGLHGWNLRLASHLSKPDMWLDGGYAYGQTRVPIVTYAALRERDRTDLIVGGRRTSWRAREGSFGIGASLAFPAQLYTVRLRVDYNARFLKKARDFDVELDPNEPPPRLPPLGFDATVYWSVSYASAQRQAYDISNSWGQVVTLAGSYQDPYLGSRERGYGLSFRGEQFVRFSFRESVLAIAYTAGHRTPVSLGGYPAQLVPVRDALLGTRAAPSDYARLRGFPLREGTELQVLQLEYRLLISRINHGYETLPVFARRVHAALFVDAGDAWDPDVRAFAFERLGVSVGGELRLDWASDYGSDYTLRAGLARGVTRGGELQWYTTLATPF